MIPDMVFVELSDGFGKPTKEERALLQSQQRALFEGDGAQVTLLELALEGGFVTPDEAEKFVKLAKMEDVDSPPSAERTPSGRTKVKAPSGRKRVGSPSGRTKGKGPSGRAPIKAPSARTKAKAPSGRTPTKAPSGRVSTKAPTERTRVKKPSERSSVKAPTDRTRVRKPSERGLRASERAERAASGRHATGSSSPLIPVIVGLLVFAAAGVGFVASRPGPEVAVVEDVTPLTKADYEAKFEDVERFAYEKLDRGREQKALALVDATIVEWSNDPLAAEVVLELRMLRSELQEEIEAKRNAKDDDEEDDFELPPGSARFPDQPGDETEEPDPPAETPDEPQEPRVVIVRPADPPSEDPPAKDPPPVVPDDVTPKPKPTDPKPDSPTTVVDGPDKDYLGDLETLRASGLTADYRSRVAELKPDDDEGFMRLAKWSRRNHLYAEERFALKSVLRIDPGHRTARKQLDKVVAEEKAHSQWRTPWRNEGAFLFLESNTTEAKLYHYSQSVNAFYARYSKIFKIRKSPQQRWGKKIGVRIFASRDDFTRYQNETGSQLGESAVGYYSLTNKELVLYDDPNDPDESRDTLFHEGTHLFTHLALGEQAYALPPWIVEGIAEYFGASEYDPEAGELEVGRPSYMRLRAAKRRVKRNRASLTGDLLNADFGNYRSDNYALGWALIHMLLEKTKPGGKKQLYTKGFLRCFEAVAKGEKSAAAFERYVGPIAKLEREWHEYIETFPVPLSEEALALARTGAHDEAIPLYRKHLQEFPEDFRAAYHLGESYYALNQLVPAIRAYRVAIRWNHQFLDAYEGLSLSLAAEGHPLNAIEAAQDGLERFPSARAHYILAWALHSGDSHQEALEAIREAIALDQQPLYIRLRSEIKAAMR